MRHLRSRIKFHINNVIYFRIHRSPNCCFFAFIACKSQSRHSISQMDFLEWFVWEKKLKWAIYVGSVLHTSTKCGRLYVCIQSTHIYLRYIIFASHVTFSFESSILALFSSLSMALPKKRVRTLHDRLKIIQEVQKGITAESRAFLWRQCRASFPFSSTVAVPLRDTRVLLLPLMTVHVMRYLWLWTSVRIVLCYLYIITDVG
jgi:hypothetical protein